MTKMNQRKDVTAEILVGAFMFIIMAMLLVVTVVISQNRFFQKSYYITANFASVGGLRQGEEVFFRGVKVGNVEKIEIREAGKGVQVDMKLTREVILYEGYIIEVEVASLLGGMRVMITEGDDKGTPVPQELYSDLQGTSPQDVLALAADAVEDIRKALVEEGTLDNIRILSENLAAISSKIANGEGTIGKLVNDESLYTEAEELVAGLNAASKDFGEVAARINQGQGTLGKLLSGDETLYKDLEATLANIRNVSRNLADGKGVIGKLLNSEDDFYNDLRDTVASLKEFSADLMAQEGTVGRLIQDETLYLKVESLVDEARATIDDFRETSPITTFSSIFFGAF